MPRVKHNGDPLDLVSGKADAMVAYSTNEPFVLEQLGVPYLAFRARIRHRFLQRQPGDVRKADQDASSARR